MVMATKNQTSQKFGYFWVQHCWLCKHTSCGLRKPPLGGSTTPITSPLLPGGLSKCFGSTSSALPQRNSALVIPEWVGSHKKKHTWTQYPESQPLHVYKLPQKDIHIVNLGAMWYWFLSNGHHPSYSFILPQSYIFTGRKGVKRA